MRDRQVRGARRRRLVLTLPGLAAAAVAAATLSSSGPGAARSVFLAGAPSPSEPARHAAPVEPVGAVQPAAPAAPTYQAPVQTRPALTTHASASAAFSPGSHVDAADIPAVALGAYQRAAAVMSRAAASCGLDWTLVAAVGYVESDNGTRAGGRLDDKGVAEPALVSDRLDGRHGRLRVPDTDGGTLDGDRRFDRAVGPMMMTSATPCRYRDRSHP